MRKSERLRLAEMQILRLEMQIEILNSAFNSVIEAAQASTPAPVQNLDAQKWYTREAE